MSTKTNFKRIALVAVAALGLGVLSSVPSQALGNQHILTVTNGEQVLGGSIIAESATAASAALSFIANTAVRGDTYSITATLKSAPTGNVALPLLLVDTYTANTDVDTDGSPGNPAAITSSSALGGQLAQGDTRTATTLFVANRATGATTPVLVSATFKVMMPATAAAGTYVVTLTSDPSVAGSSDNVPAAGVDVTITVAGLSAVASQTRSTAFLSNGAASTSTSQIVDSSVAAVSTASTTVRGQLTITLKGATSATDAVTAESVTVTTTVGLVGPSTGGGTGRSVVFAYSPNTPLVIGLYSDGTAGTATITATSASTTFTKTASFYSATMATATATVVDSVVGLSTAAILGVARDANGINQSAGTTLWAYSSDTSVVSTFGTACGSFSSATGGVLCTLTGVKNGTANITLRNASTVAASTVASTPVAVTVNLNTAAAVQLTWDKATYSPGERAVIQVRVVDSAGKSLPAGTYSQAISSAGIASSTFALTATSGSLTATDIVTAANSTASATSPVVTNVPVSQIVVTMPNTGGSISVSATGGSGLPAAGRVAVTATATITDNAAAALAAVNALATTVASLRTLITTLTNLVLKIQKKVRA